MPIVTRKADVERIYAEAAAKGICLPVFAAEDRETLEGILCAGLDVASDVGRADLPVTVTWTNRYPKRPQMTKVFGCGDSWLGMRAMLSDLHILMDGRSPYSKLVVLPNLDHFVPKLDAEILDDLWEEFASVLVDASDETDAESIAITRHYVERLSGNLVVEGVVDGIAESGNQHSSPRKTTVEKAKAFLEQTGVDLIVPNVGTEHRSTSQTLAYDEHLARSISNAVGHIMSLHGASSLTDANFGKLSETGFLKVNIFTVLAVAGGQAVAQQVLQSVGGIFGTEGVSKMVKEGFLGDRFLTVQSDIQPHLQYLANETRRNAWLQAVRMTCRRYFNLLGYARYKPKLVRQP